MALVVRTAGDPNSLAPGAFREIHAVDVVFSTCCTPPNCDYKLTVIADYCADLDAQFHETLLTRLFPQRADVLIAAEFVKARQSA
jgi:hypothetical protein